MAKIVKAATAKDVKDALQKLAKERQESGCTMNDKELSFIVKLVKECAG